MLGTYLKAAAPLIPGAGKLPFIAGGGGELPERELSRELTPDRDHVAAYAKVCEFGLRDALPVTYPHLLAFPLHMELMTSGDFPFGAIGLVHIENAITQHRPIAADETLELHVRAADLRPHPRGRAFSIVTDARAGGEVAWEATSTMLRRGGGEGSSPARDDGDRGAPKTVAEWRLGGDLGRRYASVSGDRNPIHMHNLTAKAFGFPRAIAHGMWTKARCLAALEPRLPDSFSVEVRFRRPILLPATVAFGSEGSRFTVRDAQKDVPHLDGSIQGDLT